MCPACNSQIQPAFFFCPNCGKKLKEPQDSTTVGKQIVLYTTAVLIPPSGLFIGIKYLKQSSDKAKYIGTTLIVLTIVSTLLSIYLAVGFYNRTMQILNAQLGGALEQQLNSGVQNQSKAAPQYLKQLGY